MAATGGSSSEDRSISSSAEDDESSSNSPAAEDDGLTREEREEKEKEAKDLKVIDTIEEKFFDPKFDIDKLVEELPRDLDEAYLAKQIELRNAQLEAISSRLASRIMGSYDQFVQGMVEIGELNCDIERTAKLCDTGRRYLLTAKQSLTHTGLTVLSNHRKRLIYRQIIDCLEEISQVNAAQAEIKEFVEAGDFPKAIERCQECMKTLTTVKDFTIARILQKRLGEAYAEVQNKLDNALVDLCRYFVEDRYKLVLEAYRLLGKHYTVVEKIQRFYLNSVASQCHDVMFSHILQVEALTRGSTPSELKKKSFKELCQMLPDDLLQSCLAHVLTCFTDLMHSHWVLANWHSRNDAEERKRVAKLQAEQSVSGAGAGAAARGSKAAAVDILAELERFKKTMWDHMQRKCSLMLSTSNLARFKIDSFLKVLDAVTRFTKIGEAFSSGTATGMENVMKKQSKLYFYNYHKLRLEDLRTMLENEMWIGMPVQANFTIYDIKEFSTFLESTSMAADASALSETVNADAFFNRYDNPFSHDMKEMNGVVRKEKRDGNAAEDDDVPDELKQEYIDEEGDGRSHPRRRRSFDEGAARRGGPSSSSSSVSSAEVGSSGPLLSSTSINVLRYMGKYLHMMKILRSISSQVFYGYRQIFEYYMYSCYSFFGGQNSGDHAFGMSASLKKTLKRIQMTLIQPGEASVDAAAEFRAVAAPISPIVKEDLDSADMLFGVPQRTIATESLIFIAQSLQSCRVHLEQILPKTQQPALAEFYTLSVDACAELRKFLHYCTAKRVLDLGDLATNVGSVKWDLTAKDLGMGLECSSYVHSLNNKFALFAKRMDEAAKVHSVPKDVIISVWTFAVKIAMYQLVDGFSRSRRCTNEGRVLMNLDLQTFRAKLQELCPVKPVPHVEYVETYIKAFYISQAELLPWVKEQTDYTARQLMSVTIVASQKMPQNVRVQLVKAVEDYLSNRQKSSSSTTSLAALKS